MSFLERAMIRDGFMIDLMEVRDPFMRIIQSITDPVDFALILKPELTHVNSQSLNRLYYGLCKCEGKIEVDSYCMVEAYELIRECVSNERVYYLIKSLIHRFNNNKSRDRIE